MVAMSVWRPTQGGWRGWVIRLFSTPPVVERPEWDEQSRRIDVPVVKPDPDKHRLREALDRLDMDVRLLQRGDHSDQRG